MVGDREIWVSRSVAVNVAIIVRCKHKIYVLTGKRGDHTPDFQGYWNVPCGYLDWDENGTEACYREVREETGLHLEKFIYDNPSPVNMLHMVNPWKVITEPTSNRQNVSLRYGAFIVADELPELTTKYADEGEVAEVEWFELNDLSDLTKKEWAFNHDQLLTEYIKNLGLLNVSI